MFYDEAADLLCKPAEAVKRLALRRGWPCRSAPAGGTIVAAPEAVSGEPRGDADLDGSDLGRAGARTLLAYLQAHVERLTEELAEARNKMRCVRYEAGRAQVAIALVEAERARSAEVCAERDRLAAELARPRAADLPEMQPATAPFVLSVRPHQI